MYAEDMHRFITVLSERSFFYVSWKLTDLLLLQGPVVTSPDEKEDLTAKVLSSKVGL